MYNQSSLVKLLNNTGLFKLSAEEAKLVRFDKKDKMCMLVDMGEIINVKDGEQLYDSVLNVNQTVIIKPNVSLIPHRYHAIVSYNSQLAMAGLLVTPVSPFVRPGEEQKIALLARASKKVDLAEFDHIFELYQID